MNCEEMISFSPSNTKCFSLVKLNSEALQCIEEYARNEFSGDANPTIKVEDGQGVLSIPGKDGIKTFFFNLSDVEGNESQGSFQCVEKSLEGEMMSLGNIETKMQILALNASIADTKSKIEADDEKQKKYGAKVIKGASSSAPLATSSQGTGQAIQAESTTPRERKKAVPLLKKLLSRNFIRGLRSGIKTVSTKANNSSSPRGVVLLNESLPMSTSREKKMEDQKKKRMFEDRTTETYSDVRKKKQRIAHCSLNDLPPISKVSRNLSSISSRVIKSKEISLASGSKTSSQETKKRKQGLRNTQKESSTSTINNKTSKLSAINESLILNTQACSTVHVKSEKVAPVQPNSLSAENIMNLISLYKSKKSSLSTKTKEIPVENKLNTKKSRKVGINPGNKMSPQELKLFRKKLKNRRRRRRFKLKIRLQKQACAEALKLATPKTPKQPLDSKSQVPKTLSVTPTANISNLQSIKLNARLEQPLMLVEKNNLSKLNLILENLIDTTEFCEEKQIINQEKPEGFLIDEKLNINKLYMSTKLIESSSQDYDFSQERSEIEEVNTEDNTKPCQERLVTKHEKQDILSLNVELGISKYDPAVKKLAEISQGSDVVQKTSTVIKEVKSKDPTKPCLERLVTKQENQDFLSPNSALGISKCDAALRKLSDNSQGSDVIQKKTVVKAFPNDIHIPSEKKVAHQQKLDDFSFNKELRISKFSESNSQNSDRTEKGFQIDASPCKNNPLKDSTISKAETNKLLLSTKSVDDLEATSSKVLSFVQLPDLVQHCDRFVTVAHSDNEEIQIPNLEGKQVETHPIVGETKVNAAPDPVHETSHPNGKDSFEDNIPEAGRKSTSKQHVLKKPCSNNDTGGEFSASKVSNSSQMQPETVTSSQEEPRMLTSCLEEPRVPSSSQEEGGVLTSFKKEPRVHVSFQEEPIASVSNHIRSDSIMPLTIQEPSVYDCITEFEEITSLEQRQIYKRIFDEKYAEYMKLQEDLPMYDNYLQSLERTWKIHSKGSDVFNELKTKLHQKFNYHKKRTQEFTALHSELKKIKDHISKFDSTFM